MFEFINGTELKVLINFGFSMLAGILIGIERESRGKPAGISTFSLVISGSMVFTFLSSQVDPASTTRIAAYVVGGIGFLGGGMIIKGDIKNIFNLTTAASIWFAASIGMAIGFGYYFLAIIGIIVCVLTPRIPHIAKIKKSKTISKSQNSEDDYTPPLDSD
ncbi:MAG: MgtC/SapB family protein [Candidatus Nitrosotenuis sp.]|uniref:MgtC family magnesium (Mg2+) transporter n=1 Tax=Candidatus Nitrosotenuis uzonensis TaxID=1407055 RepID=A0A812EWH1_9ARCH|nr:MgtC/SapB family protein [Candidatus Nitrosotenuis uzonensis]CAE6494208.1 MgtC family magnesium (Mg2+) transporter [Candidatus Nitrosotenuis uzonensis]